MITVLIPDALITDYHVMQSTVMWDLLVGMSLTENREGLLGLLLDYLYESLVIYQGLRCLIALGLVHLGTEAWFRKILRLRGILVRVVQYCEALLANWVTAGKQHWFTVPQIYLVRTTFAFVEQLRLRLIACGTLDCLKEVLRVAWIRWKRSTWWFFHI